jgi:putative DNA primase/helicase
MTDDNIVDANLVEIRRRRKQREAAHEVADACQQDAPNEAEIRAEINRLAALSDLVYQTMRRPTAARLNMTPAILDRYVRQARKAEDKKPEPPLYPHWAVEPWPEEVETDALLRDITARIQRHIVCSNDTALASALWVALSWVHDAATFSPMLVVTSAEPMSGKTTLLRIISFLCPRSISTVEVSEAALYRAIDKFQPTFVIDEFDTVLANPDKGVLRSVINSGHTRGDGILRVNMDKDTLETFSTFSPKAIGMIGRKLPPATLTRCIFVDMKRRTRDERVEKFKHVDDVGLAELRSKLARWAKDNIEALREADPIMPDEFENRYGDNWRLQFAIADLAGDDCAENARIAAINIERTSDNATSRAKLLKAIQTTLADRPGDISSQTLIEDLISLPESDYAEWAKGKPISQKHLTNMLKDFGIRPQQVRVNGHQVRGYLRAQFEDAWARYL